MHLIPVTHVDIQLGCPLPYDLLTAEGKLLVKKGFLVANEERLAWLLENAFRVVSTRAEVHRSTFEQMESIAVRLGVIEEDIVQRRGLEGWLGKVSELVRDLIVVSDADADACFAAMHLDVRHPYDVIHHCMAAVICARVSKQIALSEEDRFALVAGAITHDISLLASRHMLESEGELTEIQKLKIKNHPLDGVELLRTLGVDSLVWLEVVLNHHEYLDGSGYRGLAATEQSVCVRIIALADALSAMLRPRPYREKMLAKVALGDLYLDQRGRYDRHLLTRLVQSLGIYPPGTVARNASGETVVVLRKGEGGLESPLTVAIQDRRGHLFLHPTLRDAAHPEFAITEVVPVERASIGRKLVSEVWSMALARRESVSSEPAASSEGSSTEA